MLVIPLGGVYIFRFYEGELVKQTEVELIAQAALIAAVYKREVETLMKPDGPSGDYGNKVAVPPTRDDYFQPVKPQLSFVRLSY